MAPKRKVFVGVSRTSSYTNAQGDSTKRQKKSMCKFKLDKNIVNLGVSGRTNLSMRPYVADLVKDNAKAGKSTVLVFENETRLARSMKVQEEALEWAAKNGVTLVHAGHPDLWTSDLPEKK